MKPETALVAALALAIAVRFLWRELVSAIVIGCLVLVFVGILYLCDVTSAGVLSGT